MAIRFRAIDDGEQAVVGIDGSGYGMVARDFDGLRFTAPVLGPVVPFERPFTHKLGKRILGKFSWISSIEFELDVFSLGLNDGQGE